MSSGWPAAATGLDTHRNAVLIRIVVAIIGVIYVATLVISKTDGPSSSNFLLVLGLAELVGTVIALVGVVRFGANLPKPTKLGVSFAWFASFASFALIGVVVAELYFAWIAWRMVQLWTAIEHNMPWEMSRIEALMVHVARVPYANMLGALAGLVAVIIVLSSIVSCGQTLGDHVLVRRARRMRLAVVSYGVGYGVISSWIIDATGSPRVIALGTLAIFGLGLMLAYAGVLTTASKAMRSGSVAIPPAQLRR